jgi:hypothetical protein
MRQSMVLCFTLGVAMTVASAVRAEDAKKPAEVKKPGAAADAAAQAPGMPPLPAPGPEHALLKGDVGVWDAAVEIFGGPAPTTSKGSETNTLLGNGLWLITDFKGEMMGAPFQGHGTAGWDPAKKKYVGTWVDTMSTGVLLSEGTYDASTKTMTSWMEGPDMTGKVTKMRTVTEYKSPDSRVFTMYAPGPDGKEAQTMRITYTRRK